MDTIGERIVYLRGLHGMTQRKLMDELNITNLGRVEKNIGMPGVDMIISISDYFNVTTDWLLKGKEKNVNINSQNCLQCQQHANLLKIFNELSITEKASIEKIIGALIISKQIQDVRRTDYTEEDIKNYKKIHSASQLSDT